MSKDWSETYVPRTELGRRLVAIRREYVRGGGVLISEQDFDDYISRRNNDDRLREFYS